jgi:hypothetical protein
VSTLTRLGKDLLVENNRKRPPPSRVSSEGAWCLDNKQTKKKSTLRAEAHEAGHECRMKKKHLAFLSEGGGQPWSGGYWNRLCHCSELAPAIYPMSSGSWGWRRPGGVLELVLPSVVAAVSQGMSCNVVIIIIEHKNEITS